MDDRFHSRLWRRATTVTRPARSPSLRIVEGMRECPTCGLFQRVPRLEPGHLAECGRCGGRLARRRRTRPIAAPASFCAAAIAVYAALLLSSLMTINVYGRENTISLMSGPLELIAQGYGEIGVLIAIVTVVMPGIVLALMAAILYGGSRSHMPDWTPHLLTWYERLRGWSMVEVYVLGVLVAYTKLVDLAVVLLQPGIYLLGALMVMMAAVDSTFDTELIWKNRDVETQVEDRSGRSLDVAYCDARTDTVPPVQNMLACHACDLVLAYDHPVPQEHDMGDCPRCGHVLRRRKRLSLSTSSALLIAAIIFYIPANLMPVMTYAKVGAGQPSTIMNGVIELWKANLVPLALLVLFASITVPVLKIVSLAIMLICTRFRWSWRIVGRTKLYRIVDIIGRWSMIDVFMISILAAIVHFQFLANVTADFGMVCFALVVILTIFAAELFDPRGMWDAVGRNGPVPSPATGNHTPETPVHTSFHDPGGGSSDDSTLEPEHA